MNNFYVYEHIRNDNNQCFYVGKGCGRRAYSKDRNKHHDRVANKYGMHIKIIKDNLSEEEAFELEKDLIKHYVFDLGYGIDITGYNNLKNENGHLTNQTFGGDGSSGVSHTKEWCEEHSTRMIGKNNPAYGKNYWETYSEEKKKEIKKIFSVNNSGQNNPMYGISPKERMSEETYEQWRIKQKENKFGDKNPNYGNDTLHNKLLNNPELKMQYYSRPRGQNGRARKIELYDINMNYINTFDCITECAEYIKERDNSIKTKINSMLNPIQKAAKSNKIYKNYKYKLVN